MSLMKDAAATEIGRRHPYFVRYGARITVAFLVLLALLAAVLLVRSAVDGFDGGPDWSIPRPSGRVLLVLLLVPAGAAVAGLIAYLRSPLRTPRMWWR